MDGSVSGHRDQVTALFYFKRNGEASISESTCFKTECNEVSLICYFLSERETGELTLFCERGNICKCGRLKKEIPNSIK